MRRQRIDKEMRDFVLAHRKLSTVSAHYERNDLILDRRDIHDRWAEFVSGKLKPVIETPAQADNA